MKKNWIFLTLLITLLNLIFAGIFIDLVPGQMDEQTKLKGESSRSEATPGDLGKKRESSDKNKETDTDQDAVKLEDDLDPVLRFNDLHKTIYTGVLPVKEARKIFHEVMPKIAKLYWKLDGKKYGKKDWIFPVKGYNRQTTRLSRWDFKHVRRFNYFSNKATGGHPAFDLYIRDKNQDCIDDSTGESVKILSVTGGIVIASVSDWSEKMNTPGGNNILIYDPHLNGVFYYAHNKEVLVKPGDIVHPGDIIATMGRTGRKAYNSGSPTHLHIGYFKVKPYDLEPVNIYLDLKYLKTIK